MENYTDCEAGFTLLNFCHSDPSLVSASHLCNLYNEQWQALHSTCFRREGSICLSFSFSAKKSLKPLLRSIPKLQFTKTNPTYSGNSPVTARNQLVPYQTESPLPISYYLVQELVGVFSFWNYFHEIFSFCSNLLACVQRCASSGSEGYPACTRNSWHKISPSHMVLSVHRHLQ